MGRPGGRASTAQWLGSVGTAAASNVQVRGKSPPRKEGNDHVRLLVPFALAAALTVAAVAQAAAQTNASLTRALIGVTVQAIVQNVDVLNNSLNDVIDVNINDSFAEEEAHMRDMQTMTDTDLWTYRDYQSWAGTDLTGFDVRATDGEIGSVDRATYDVGASYLVVDTGPWIFGKKVMVPAGIIDRVDTLERRVFVNRTKDQIKNAPEFDEATHRDEAYRSGLGEYYAQREAGYRDMDR